MMFRDIMKNACGACCAAVMMCGVSGVLGMEQDYVGDKLCRASCSMDSALTILYKAYKNDEPLDFSSQDKVLEYASCYPKFVQQQLIPRTDNLYGKNIVVSLLFAKQWRSLKKRIEQNQMSVEVWQNLMAVISLLPEELQRVSTVDLDLVRKVGEVYQGGLFDMMNLIESNFNDILEQAGTIIWENHLSWVREQEALD
jgi:hypothetical protein